MTIKLYFEEHEDEKDRIGVTTPEELKEMFKTMQRRISNIRIYKVTRKLGQL